MCVCQRTWVNVLCHYCANADIDGTLTWHWYWSPKLCNPLMMNESVAVGWPIVIQFATGRPICMQLACWWHRGCARTDGMTEWERGVCSALFNRMIVDAGRGAGDSLALSGCWCCSSTRHILSALVWHEGYKHVEVSEAAPSPLYNACGSFH